MFDEDLINGDGLKTYRSGASEQIAFKVRLPWYRSLYLSCLESANVSIGGAPIALEHISFRLYGRTYPFDDLKQFYEVLWFVLDAAEMIVEVPQPLAEGSHEVILTLFVRIPYHRSLNFKQMSTCTKLMRVERQVAA
jgi:hypothetical protein